MPVLGGLSLLGCSSPAGRRGCGVGLGFLLLGRRSGLQLVDRVRAGRRRLALERVIVGLEESGLSWPEIVGAET